MTPNQWAMLWGALFIAGVPTAAVIYYFAAIKRGQHVLGVLGAVSCLISGLVGGLIFALPALAIFLVISYSFARGRENRQARVLPPPQVPKSPKEPDQSHRAA